MARRAYARAPRDSDRPKPVRYETPPDPQPGTNLLVGFLGVLAILFLFPLVVASHCLKTRRK